MIRLEGVSKEYGLFGRRVPALAGVSLEIPRGVSVGIVGPNGAGKSTLLRLLLGYLRPTSGALRIDGLSPREYVERAGIAYVPERPAVPPRWTVRHALHAFAALGDVEPWRERVAGVLADLGLEPVADRRAGALSKGNLQRLALAQALLGDRSILILDEPTDGVDPEWRARIRDLLAQWRAADPDRLLLFASHDLDEVERVADRVVVLLDGRIREVLELRAPDASLPPYRLELHAPDDVARAAVAEAFPGADPDGDGWTVRADDAADLSARLASLLARGATVRALVPRPQTLEQRFRRSVGGEAGRGREGAA